MKNIKTFLSLGAAFFFLNFMPFSLTSAGAAYYKYVDKHGTVHFTDRYESIPQEYRDQIKTFREEPKPQPVPPPPELREKKREGEPAAEDRASKVGETGQKEAQAVEARKKEVEEKKQKDIEEKEKRIEELQKQIDDKRKQQRGLRTNWMVYDRNTIIRLNQEISVLEKKIKAFQDELAEGK